VSRAGLSTHIEDILAHPMFHRSFVHPADQE
jgi:hypothetical protein